MSCNLKFSPLRKLIAPLVFQAGYEVPFRRGCLFDRVPPILKAIFLALYFVHSTCVLVWCEFREDYCPYKAQ